MPIAIAAVIVIAIVTVVVTVDVTAIVIIIAKFTITIRAGGSCEGGNPAGVYEFAAKVRGPLLPQKLCGKEKPRRLIMMLVFLHYTIIIVIKAI